MMKNIKKLLLSVGVLLALGTASAQAQQPTPTSINNLIEKIGNYNKALPAEKLYLRFDKPYYAVSDTIWFSGFILNSGLSYSNYSRRLYVELVNDSNAVVRRMVFPAVLGICYGNIDLNPSVVREGTYTIRAYTNWMRNFGDDYFFKQSFYINNRGDDTWLVNQQSILQNNNLQLGLQLKNTDGRPTGLTNLQLKVSNNKSTLLRNVVQTQADGSLNINFALPEKTPLKNLRITATDKDNVYKKVIIPLSVNRPQDVDIQFMPEGGHLVNNLPSKVGFKAIGEDGAGVEVSGSVFDSDSVEVASIKTQHNGMGWFSIVPMEGKKYTAKLNLPGGLSKTLTLPAAQASGTGIKITNNYQADTLLVTAYASNQATDADNNYMLIGMARNQVCFGATLNLSQGSARAKVPTALFPSGIAHFILVNAQQKPLNERMVFINHNDALRISINTDKKTFATRDSVAVKFKVTDEQNNPVQGCFSVAVTDAHQVKTQAYADNIATHLLLTGDLKGYVEDPAYYLQANKQAWEALDALLLTQGWVGYNLDKLNQKIIADYKPENSFSISGTVTNLFNKPIANSNVLLVGSGKNHYIKDTTANQQGRFTFDNLPDADKNAFILSARRSHGGVINGGISIDDKNQIPVASPIEARLRPWNVNADSTLLNYVKTSKQYQQVLDKANFGMPGHMLHDVTIRERARIKNSQSLNSPDEVDQTLDENAMINANKATLAEVLEKSVKGFHSGFARDSAHAAFGSSARSQLSMTYMIKDKKARFVFDGVDIDRYYEPSGMPDDHFQYVKQYLDYITAEDLLGIEVIYSQNGRYNAQNLNSDELIASSATAGFGGDYAYIEITTRSGNGPNLKRATGVYVYRPIPATYPKEFYSPRYPFKDAPRPYADLRSTIHWVPTAVTNKNGEATISFYTADLPTQYNIGIEGSNLDGKFGLQNAQITVSNGAK